jgi:hypothetical protein
MNPSIPSVRSVRWLRAALGCCLLLVVWSTAHSQVRFVEEKKDEPAVKGGPVPRIVPLPVEPGAVHVVFTDGSNLKMLLRDERIALTTPYGKLSIPATDIRRIEFATRVSEEDAKLIQTSIAELGHTEFSKRQDASARLLKLGATAYPALLRAVEDRDLEVARRARELIQQLGTHFNEAQLRVHPKDIIYTNDSAIAGRIDAGSLKAHTTQFGDLQVKLKDISSLHSQAVVNAESSIPVPMGLR